MDTPVLAVIDESIASQQWMPLNLKDCRHNVRFLDECVDLLSRISLSSRILLTVVN